jgi:hypothetical protein
MASVPDRVVVVVLFSGGGGAFDSSVVRVTGTEASPDTQAPAEGVWDGDPIMAWTENDEGGEKEETTS